VPRVCGSAAVVARSLRAPVLMDRSRFSSDRDKLNRQIQEVERLVTRRKQTTGTRSNRQKIQFCKTKNLTATGASTTNLRAFPTGLPRAFFAKGSVCTSTFLTGSAPQTEFAVTYSKQKTATFLTGSRFACHRHKRYLPLGTSHGSLATDFSISTRFCAISRNRLNSLKTNARRISTRFPNCTSAQRMRVLLPGKIDANDVVFYFDHAAGVFEGGFLAQLLHRGVVGAAVEPAGVVDQQDVAANGMAVDGGEFLLDGRGNVVIVRVEPEKAGLFERGQELGQDFSAVTFQNVNVRALCEFSPSAFGPPAVELDGVNLAKPVLVHVEHVREVRSGFHQNVQIESASELRDRALLHQVRRAGSGHSAKFPRSIFAASGNTFVQMKERAIAERLPEFRHDPAA
jgi:hypothetical protein